MKILAGTAAAAALLLTLAACGADHPAPTANSHQQTDQSDQSDDGDDQPVNNFKSCQYLAKADVESVLGEPVKDGVDEIGASDGEKVLSATCNYSAVADNGNNIQLSVGSEAIIRPSIGEGGKPIADLGDEARGANGIIYFRKGDKSFLITEVKNRHDESQLDPATFIPLAQQALTKA
ncbi:hypothetical protein OG474_37285 [Kribbella sp. NBC_01505]|uniref:hypothetical protein n=1 Tax=Kribbella sp. NBC_01505 TaxID=2903580 RepID=UPI0038639B57